MKQFKYTALLFLLASFMLVSCEKEEKFSFDTGVQPSISEVEGFIDITNPPNTSVKYTLDNIVSTTGSGQIDIYKSMLNEKVLYTTVNTSDLPVTFELGVDEVMEGFSYPIDSLKEGDLLRMKQEVHTGDGRVLANNVNAIFPASCSSDIDGLYSVSTTYTQHDFLADFPSYDLAEVLLTDLGGGKYSIEDLSGGLYSVGPYVDAYGTSGIAAEILDVCNNITWNGQSDPWGAVIPLDGGVNERDPDTGVITISWFCEAYSESGVSVYTPL